jgi:hypothetical protein
MFIYMYVCMYAHNVFVYVICINVPPEINIFWQFSYFMSVLLKYKRVVLGQNRFFEKKILPISTLRLQKCLSRLNVSPWIRNHLRNSGDGFTT